MKGRLAPGAGPGSIVAILSLLLVVGCATGASTFPSDGSGNTVELTVYGASSLKRALEEIETAYEAAVPGVDLTVATDASSTLRTQIEQGAPADIFLSADQRNPDALVAGDLTDGDAIVFARNELTVIVPIDNPAAITVPADLGKPGIKIVAAGDDVPITTYATRVVDLIAATADDPAGYAAAYAANVVSKEENVSAVVGKIELGEGDAAIVYITDARASTRVAAVDIAEETNVVASYAGVVVKASAHPTEAHAFLDWLTGPAGTAVLATSGFLPPA